MENKTEKDKTVGDDTESSSNNQMNSKASSNGDALRMRKLAHQVRQRYKISYIFRRVRYCPDTRCNNYKVSFDIVQHYLEVHQSIPKIIIKLHNSYVIPLELQQLEYGKNQILAILLFPVTKDYGTPDDYSTMPLVVLAAKIHPSGNLNYVTSHTDPSNTEDKLLHNGDILIIWVCGHMRALRTVLKVTGAMETKGHEYNGCIHHLADNNHHPHMVLARGNCLLVPVSHIISLSDNGIVPLDLSVTIFVEEQELTNLNSEILTESFLR
ncbi:hypothetical protein CBL_13347 [Carabus blaptoides fortunei]